MASSNTSLSYTYNSHSGKVSDPNLDISLVLREFHSMLLQEITFL